MIYSDGKFFEKADLTVLSSQAKIKFSQKGTKVKLDLSSAHTTKLANIFTLID
jgi:hypothetical protein